MVRTRVKGNWLKAASSPETEPDFYSMEPCLPRTDVPLLRAGNGVGVKADTSSERVTSDVKNSKSAAPESPKITFRKISIAMEGDCESHLEPKIKNEQLGSFIPDKVPSFGHMRSLVGMMAPRVISPPPPLALLSDDSETPFSRIPLEDDENNCGLTLSQERPLAPSPGDVIYFEGLQFYYLDHMELEEVEKIVAAPKDPDDGPAPLG